MSENGFFYQNTEAVFPIKNVLNIKEASAYTCTVFTYHSESHSHLKINAICSDDVDRLPPYRIEFLGVIYFEGVMEWQNADFHVAEPEEFDRYMSNSELYDAFPPGVSPLKWREAYTMFTVKATNCTIRIIASNIYHKQITSAKQLYQ